MERKEYNGYTNYETWVVALWIDNEQGSQEYWASIAYDLSSPDSPEYIADEAHRTSALADRLKSEHEESLPEVQGFAADLLNAAMSEVDWYDVAENMIVSAVEEIRKES